MPLYPFSALERMEKQSIVKAPDKRLGGAREFRYDSIPRISGSATEHFHHTYCFHVPRQFPGARAFFWVAASLPQLPLGVPGPLGCVDWTRGPRGEGGGWHWPGRALGRPPSPRCVTEQQSTRPTCKCHDHLYTGSTAFAALLASV